MIEYYPVTYRPHAERAYHLLTRKPVLLFSVVLTTFLLFAWYDDLANLRYHKTRSIDRRTDFDGRWIYERDRNNLLLDDAQCGLAFPRLFDEIDRAVSKRREDPITVEELDAIQPKNGYIRAMIYDQQLYVIEKQGDIYSRELATLHAIYRAVITSPTPLPNIEFAFNTDDIIFDAAPLWGYARRAEHEHIWLMPDFGFWSWPETKVGTMWEVQTKISVAEKTTKHPWHKKTPQLFWRGATMGLPLRDRLLEVTLNKTWADVVALDWHNTASMQTDLTSMPDHCKYKYLVHTEGNSYSGRLKYLQACKSVIIAHKMDWIQHHYPLMESSGPNQNYIEVDREFAALEEMVDFLQRHDRQAEKIAARNVKMFRERYLTPAAEACYWRRLIRGWSEVSFQPESYRVDKDGTRRWRGVPFESFALERRLKWDPY